MEPGTDLTMPALFSTREKQRTVLMKFQYVLFIFRSYLPRGYYSKILHLGQRCCHEYRYLSCLNYCSLFAYSITIQ
jgi:hypothetical protein